MTQLDIILPTEPAQALPSIRHVSFADLGDAIRKGWDDFMAMPTHIVFLCAIYPVAGMLLFSVTSAFDLFGLVYPLAAGFALGSAWLINPLLHGATAVVVALIAERRWGAGWGRFRNCWMMGGAG